MAAIRKILFIEDESVICELATSRLEDWTGTEVECVAGGKEAAQKIRSDHYSLAVIDCLLPDLPGLQLAELAVNENIAVLLMTGHPDIIAKLEATDFPYLCKPFSFDELLLRSQAAVADARNNIQRVKASLAVLKSRQEALAATLNQSKALMLEAVRTTQTARKVV
jgi:DNA-binding response OmpR family regulator